MLKLYIILPVHNRRNITLKFIANLKQQTFKNYQLVLVDDGSTDGTSEAVKTLMPESVIIKGKGDWWWAGGLQQGINWLKHSDEVVSDDAVLMINDDVQFEDDFLEKGLNIINSEKDFLLLAECHEAKTGKILDRGVKADLCFLKLEQAKSPEEINCLSTMGLFMKIATLKKIGDFSPNFLPHYLSDYEFTIRAYRKGLTLRTNPALKLWVNAETSGYDPFQEKDLITFIRKYFSVKSNKSPWSWSAFIILASPKLWIPLNLLVYWTRISKVLLKYTYYSIRRHPFPVVKRYWE